MRNEAIAKMFQMGQVIMKLCLKWLIANKRVTMMGISVGGVVSN